MANVKLDWKEISKSSGYVSLKNAYIEGLQHKRHLRNKKDFRKEFYRIIGLVQHYAQQDTSVSFIQVLNAWENDRLGWWFGHYRNTFKKLHSNALKTMGPKGIRKYRKKFSTRQYIKKSRCQDIMLHQKQASKKEPKRWPMNRKIRQQHGYSY